MRCYLIACAAAALSPAAGPASDKKADRVPDLASLADRIVGTWAMTHFDGDPAARERQTNVFRADGTMAAHCLNRDRQPVVRTGTYRLQENDLHLDFEEAGEPGEQGFVRIEKLTADDLVGGPKSEGGTRVVFKRVREKKQP